MVCAVGGAYINCQMCLLRGLLRARLAPSSHFIHTSSFNYQVPTPIICVDKSDDTRKDVLLEVLPSYAV